MALSRAALQDPRVDSRAQNWGHALPGPGPWAPQGEKAPKRSPPPTRPGHSRAPRHKQLPSHEERGVPGRKDMREPHFPARLPAPGPPVSPAPGRPAATPDGAAGAGCFQSSARQAGPGWVPAVALARQNVPERKLHVSSKMASSLETKPQPGSPSGARVPTRPPAGGTALYLHRVTHPHGKAWNTQTHNTRMKTPAKRAWHDTSPQPPGFVVKAPRRPDQRQEASGLSSSHTCASKGASPQACVLGSRQVLGAQLPASTWGPAVDSELTPKGLGGHSGNS